MRLGSAENGTGRRRRALRLALAAAVLAGVVPPVVAAAQAADPPHVLVWGGSYGFRHPSITDGERAFLELGQETGKFTVEVTENPADLTAAKLADVDVLAWVSTTGKPPLTEQQRSDIVRWAYCGGGTLAFHAAADSNYGWAEHAELLGAQFDSHPKGAGSGEARMIVEDNRHPITAGWKGKKSFLLDDEYYRWRTAKRVPGISLPRNLKDTQVLLSLDETTVGDDIQKGPLAYEHHQPIAWTKTFRGGGRVYYNNMGHSSETWSVPEFRTSLVNGIDWVSGKRPDAACLQSDKPIPGPQGPPAPNPKAVGKACPVPALAPRSGGTWENSGAAKRLTEKGDTTTLAAGIAGGLSWGAQTYVLDLSRSKARTSDVTVDLTWPMPVDDYDLSVTTGWGWYGSHAVQGDTSEQVVLRNVPHCAILQMYGDNMYGVTGQAPTLKVTVGKAAAADESDGASAGAGLPAGVVQAVVPPAGQTLGYATTTLVAPAGTPLTLNNADQTSHDLVSDATRTVVIRGVRKRVPLFRSPVTNGGRTALVAGTEKLKAGDYAFHCSLHPNMTGTFLVR